MYRGGGEQQEGKGRTQACMIDLTERGETACGCDEGEKNYDELVAASGNCLVDEGKMYTVKKKSKIGSRKQD